MNDRFKFRAKLKNINNWIFGAYLKMLPYQPNPVGHRKPLETEYKHLIITEESADWGMPRGIAAYEIIPETVGQCTGLKDKNGKLIYEGDILRSSAVLDGSKPIINVVKWNHHCWIANGTLTEFMLEISEVIGNIYENKELLNA